MVALSRNLLLFVATFGVAVAAPTDAEVIARRDAAVDSALLAMWKFNCYKAGETCSGMGATSAGGKSKVGCSPISGQGCTRFSYDGGGDWKLCLYAGNDCANDPTHTVNGGKVTCIDVGSPGSYKVVRADTPC